ncbi:hypothetical protein ASE03_22505 [Kitasatospora sp. Root187]|nr:hypothetical protein ASE03_22505 [Kitasatospora sp. Root187]
MMTACTISASTSRSARPSSSASRLTGVTRERSMIPARSSPSRLKPVNRPPKMTSTASRPGT